MNHDLWIQTTPKRVIEWGLVWPDISPSSKIFEQYVEVIEVDATTKSDKIDETWRLEEPGVMAQGTRQHD